MLKILLQCYLVISLLVACKDQKTSDNLSDAQLDDIKVDSLKTAHSNIQIDTIKDNDEKVEILNDTGIVKINFYALYYEKDTLKIYNEDNSLYAIVTRNLIIGNDTIDIMNDDINIFEYLNSRAFYPDYDIFIADCVGRSGDKYKIVINDSIKYIPKIPSLVEFETIEEHVNLLLA